MSAPLARAKLTSIVVAHLVQVLGTTVLVGRGMAPPKGGWSTGQPGTGAFVNYTTLKTGNAVTPASGNPQQMARNATSWEVSYSLTTAGALDSHADDTADLVRAAISALSGPFVLRDDTWALQQVRVPRLGPTVRNDSTDPPFWEVTDDVSVWLSLERSR
jgi:hypothetical protein